MSAQLSQPSQTTAAPEAEQQPTQRQVRVAILPAPGMMTLYANAFQTTFAPGEILLTASVSRQEKDEQGPVLALQPQAAIAMTPGTAKRLLQALHQTLQQYEAQQSAAGRA